MATKKNNLKCIAITKATGKVCPCNARPGLSTCGRHKHWSEQKLTFCESKPSGLGTEGLMEPALENKTNSFGNVDLLKIFCIFLSCKTQKAENK